MRGKLVLVVDDIVEQRDIYTALLRHHGYRVAEAGGGEAAVRAARQDRPDLVLLDMMMPETDGWEVAERLKDDPATAGIPIVALSVRSAAEDVERARDAGADGYLFKPCLPDDVLREVQRRIGPAGGDGAAG